MGHTFKFERPCVLLRRDPKWTQCPTSLYVQSKRSRNSSSINVSDAQTHIDLNEDTNEILGEIEEISPPRRPLGHDKVKRTSNYVEESDEKAKHMAEIETKFQ